MTATPLTVFDELRAIATHIFTPLTPALFARPESRPSLALVTFRAGHDRFTNLLGITALDVHLQLISTPGQTYFPSSASHIPVALS